MSSVSADLDALFAEAGRGLFEIIAGDLENIERRMQETIELQGNEVDYLLFDWLNELLYAFESRRMLFVAIGPGMELDHRRADRRRHVELRPH